MRSGQRHSQRDRGHTVGMACSIHQNPICSKACPLCLWRVHVNFVTPDCELTRPTERHRQDALRSPYLDNLQNTSLSSLLFEGQSTGSLSQLRSWHRLPTSQSKSASILGSKSKTDRSWSCGTAHLGISHPFIGPCLTIRQYCSGAKVRCLHIRSCEGLRCMRI